EFDCGRQPKSEFDDSLVQKRKTRFQSICHAGSIFNVQEARQKITQIEGQHLIQWVRIRVFPEAGCETFESTLRLFAQELRLPDVKAIGSDLQEVPIASAGLAEDASFCKKFVHQGSVIG